MVPYGNYLLLLRHFIKKAQHYCIKVKLFNYPSLIPDRMLHNVKSFGEGFPAHERTVEVNAKNYSANIIILWKTRLKYPAMIDP